MTEISTEKLQYTGRFHQFGIYFRKFLRMFVYQSDWVVLPIGAVIAALVTFVVGSVSGTVSSTRSRWCAVSGILSKKSIARACI